ncbi:hypothetical protein, partial [uncultured Thiodictyon sp.]|uniref:hypothetical protein n=1 Tax=uncultured Thiodictyon sp. TaxID=1846217 RepID=UPI0025FFEFC5
MPTPAPTMTCSPAPMRLDWCQHAAALPGKTLHLALALLGLAAEHRSAGVHLTRRTLRAWHISKDARYDALRRLRDAALIRAWQVLAAVKSRVKMANSPADRTRTMDRKAGAYAGAPVRDGSERIERIAGV